MENFYEPGTERFDSLLNLITSRTSFVEGGSRIKDQSALYHVHGEKIFDTDFAKFTLGANGRIYNPRSEGSLFSDTNGVTILNKEFGLYGGIEKRFDDYMSGNEVGICGTSPTISSYALGEWNASYH